MSRTQGTFFTTSMCTSLLLPFIGFTCTIAGMVAPGHATIQFQIQRYNMHSQDTLEIPYPQGTCRIIQNTSGYVYPVLEVRLRTQFDVCLSVCVLVLSRSRVKPE